MSASLQSKIESRFPDPDQRQAVLTAFAEAIQKAESTSPGNWIVRQRESDPVLNVRERVVFRIQNGKIRLSLDGQTLQEQGIDDPSEKFERWEAIEGKPYPEFQNPYAVNGYYTLLADDEDWPAIQQLHFAYLERLAEEGQNLREDKQSHDPVIVEFLTENVKDFTGNAQKEFTWVPFFKELGQQLKEYSENQEDLVNILHEIDIGGGLVDTSTEKTLNIIDPFTFLSLILKSTNEEKRNQYFSALKVQLNISSPVPKDYEGVPNPNKQNAWFFPNRDKREGNELDLLWKLFSDLMESGNVGREEFNDALKIHKVRIAKLTQALFRYNPYVYLPIDPNTKPYLHQHFDLKVDDIQDFDDYQKILDSLPNLTAKPFYQISKEAFMEANENSRSNRTFWRVGTSEGGDGTDMWPKMEFNNHVSIGWPILGDLRNHSTVSKELIKKELNQKGAMANNKVASRKAGEIFNFFKNAKEGDIVIACNGKEVKGIGEIKGGYQFNDSFDFPHIKEAEWFSTNPRIQFSVGLRETFKEVKENQITDEIRSLIQENTRDHQSKRYIEKETSKNQILFGPPGTGKTYQTIRQAVDIIHPGFAEGRSRAEVKTEFERLEQEGRLQFTTFHQSMTYEDFIEGIKPNLSGSEEADVAYKIEDGIFKQMAIDAGFALARANEAHAASSTLSFTDAYDNLLQDIEEHFSAGKDFTIQSKTGRSLFVDHITNQRNIAFNHAGSDRYFVVSKERLTKIHNAFEDTDLTAISNINKAFRSVIGGNDSTLYWAVLVAIRNHYLTAGQQEQPDWENYGPEDRKAAVQKLSKEELSTSDAEPYVLIIDEINRGNIAEILGELITLLEPDKRLGDDEELTVRLPYSRESFAVPPNLYVLGTMNTADRSVEALDTALRRRFDFQEITPDPELIREHRNAETIPIADEAISLPELLSTLNQRIEKLLDKDHLIGHSYFFNVAGFEDLKRVFQHNILPLLQEYFYGDFSKIGLVVGEGFVVQNEDPVTFARFPHEDRDEMARQPVIQVRDMEAMDDHAFAEALTQLLNKSGGNGWAE